MAKNFDDCRRRWANTERELGSCKEILTKSNTEIGALEVKLKHARNQVDIEIRRRQKAETECEKLVCGFACWPCMIIYADKIDYWLLFWNTGSSNSADSGPPDQRGILKQHPAECRAAFSSGLLKHKLSGSREPKHQPKVIVITLQHVVEQTFVCSALFKVWSLVMN